MFCAINPLRARTNARDLRTTVRAEGRFGLKVHMAKSESLPIVRGVRGSPSKKGCAMTTRKEALIKLKEVLLLRREALKRALDGDISMLQSLSQEGGDVMDAAMDTAQDEISSQLVEVESRELSQIDEALSKFKSNAYGDCEICDKPIPLARLQAVPYATTCIDCARKQELGQVSQGEDFS